MREPRDCGRTLLPHRAHHWTGEDGVHYECSGDQVIR